MCVSAIYCFTSYDKCTYCKSLWMKASAKCRCSLVQVKVMRVQDELESGQRSRRSGMSLQQQVGHYRRKLLQKVRR